MMERQGAVEAPAPAEQPLGEARKHQQALIRGGTLVALGIGALVLFSLITGAVLFLDPLVLDVPITRELQEIDYGPFGSLMVAVSAPGFWPWNYVFPLLIIIGLAAIRR